MQCVSSAQDTGFPRQSNSGLQELSKGVEAPLLLWKPHGTWGAPLQCAVAQHGGAGPKPTLPCRYYGLSVWFPDVIKHLQSDGYALLTRNVQRDRYANFSINFTMENQVHTGMEYDHGRSVPGDAQPAPLSQSVFLCHLPDTPGCPACPSHRACSYVICLRLYPTGCAVP